jgi:serine/threonine protein kinase
MASSFPSLEGKYEVLEKLHEGGMGAVYKVRHRLLDEVRVIKVMRPQYEADEGLRTRFLREAQMAVKLRHPHIAQMYDFAFDDSGRGFIVMEYVEGISLQQLLERVGAPDLGLSLDLARQTLEAIGFLHRKGIVHRDISPDNVMATRNDEGKTLVKLIDLGIAKVMEAGTGLTGTGTFLGKLRYASPEQFGISGMSVDPRSDIYSFGVVLYELLTDRHPLPGESPHEIIAGHLVKPPLDFALTDPAGRVPEDLRAAVLKAMAKKPEDRFASAEELDEALAAIQTRFPATGEELTEALLKASEPTAKIPPPAPGSTQARINAQFGMGATPRPISLFESDPGTGTAPTRAFTPDSTGAQAVPPPGTGSVSTGGTGSPPAGPAAPTGTTPPAPPAPGTGAGAAPAGTQPTVILAEELAKGPTPKGAPKKPAAIRAVSLPVLAAGGAVAALIIVTAVLLVLRGRPSPAPAEPAVPAAEAVPTPGPAAVPPEPTAAPPGETSQAAPQATALERAIAAGDVEQIQILFAALSKSDRAEMQGTPEGKEHLRLARRVAALDSTLAKAMKARNWEAAVENASALLKLVPNSREAREIRESAAASLEAEADALLSKGQGETALARLRALHRAWPDRPGLDARIATARSTHEADQRFAAAIAAADAAEKERQPEKGLAVLAKLTPDARWRDRFAAARSQLEALLAQMDKAAPTITLKPGFDLRYSRGKPVTVQVLVTDDYHVKSVTVMARQDGAQEYQSLPAKAVGGNEYDVEITPAFHDNKTVELYIVATDDSGHISKLGTAEKPLELKKHFLFF